MINFTTHKGKITRDPVHVYIHTSVQREKDSNYFVLKGRRNKAGCTSIYVGTNTNRKGLANHQWQRK
jgi:hypothetical protein